MDRLTGLGNDVYFACADFQASNGKVYDLDIFMNGKSSENLGVLPNAACFSKESTLLL